MRKRYLKWLLKVSASPQGLRIWSWVVGLSALALYPILYHSLWSGWVYADGRRFVIVAMLAGACVAFGVVYVFQALFVVETLRFLDREQIQKEIGSEPPSAGDVATRAAPKK